jgi:hypothetical protein
MFDVDGVYLNNGIISGIYEGKYSMYTKDKGNFIDNFYSEKNIQSLYLISVSYKIPVWLSEESTDTWWMILDGKLSQTEKPGLSYISTSDRIYIGYRISKYEKSGRIYSIFHRTLGEKPPMDNVVSTNLSLLFGVKKILVNDSIPNKIYLKNHLIESFTEVSTEKGSNWTDQWRDLGLI